MNKKNIIIGLLIILGLFAYIQKDVILEKLTHYFSQKNFESSELNIGLNTEATNLSPFSINLNNLIRTSNMYEGLVAFDTNLKIIPKLAVSWGNIDPYTWEFKLRREVDFHNGNTFDGNDVIRCFETVKNNSSELSAYLSTIKSIELTDPYNLHIVTYDPDPLLLSKLTKFHIFKEGDIGTGPYKLREWVEGNQLSLTAFLDYWGRRPDHRDVNYLVYKSKTQTRTGFRKWKN